MKLHKSIAAVLFGLLWTGQIMADDEAPIGDGINQLPIFDAHMHYHNAAWDEVAPALVIEMMDHNKVSRSLLSAAPDAGAVKLFEYAPKRFVIEASPYHDEVNNTNWAGKDVDRMMKYMTERLDQHPHEGMGELVIFSYDPSYEELLKKLAVLAESRKLLFHLHADAKVVDMIYRHAPELTIIWAHAGMVDPPHIVKQTMDKYPRLFADLSYREHEILRVKGVLNPKWKAVLIEHADRFMVGSDTWSNSRWMNYNALIQANRDWLALMPKSVAEAIAYKNAERVFKRSMSKELIGKRK